MSKNVRIFVVVLVLALIGYYFLLQKTKEASKQTGSSFLQQMMGDDWKPFAPEDGSFEILFPQTPEHGSASQPADAPGQVIHYDVFASSSANGIKYILNIARYPDSVDTSDPYKLLHALLNEMAKGAQGSISSEIVSQEESEFQGWPALTFDLKNAQFFTKGQAVFAKKSLYMLAVVGSDPEALEKSYQRFSDSFTIKEKKS